MTVATRETLDAAAAVLGPRARRDHPIGPLTTYRVGGPAALFVEAAGDADIDAVRRAVTDTGVPVLVVGKGSNLLVSDAGFAGLALTLGPAYANIEIDGAGGDADGDGGDADGAGGGRADGDGNGGDGAVVTAGAAAGLPVVARRTAKAALTGLEWAVGVPGSVGGAVRMNAGGHGSDMASCLWRWSFVDLRSGPDGERGVEDLGYGYRRSSVAPHHVVLSARFRLRPGDRRQAESTVSDIVRWRRENQPGGQNAGSVFTNPPGDSAGRLVEEAGLKGHRLGSAQVSPKHANFIQADPDGSADDVARLMGFVADEVERRMGIRLTPEVRMIGFGEGAQ